MFLLYYIIKLFNFQSFISSLSNSFNILVNSSLYKHLERILSISFFVKIPISSYTSQIKIVIKNYFSHSSHLLVKVICRS